MNMVFSVSNSIQDFIDQGGPVLWVIFGACLLMWLLILERAWFMRITWPRRAKQLVAQWNGREDCHSWRAKKIREATVSQVDMDLHARLPLIQVLVALCPLLGLLGTVLGMIGVFEVIAVSGNDDAQAMARGVYRATIPTMAGLVVALTGIYFTVRLRRLADRKTSRLRGSLTLYEPAQFLLLFADGLQSSEGREILEVRKFLRNNVKSPFGRWAAAQKLVKYWSGESAWNEMPFRRQFAMARMMPKVAAEFDAILSSNVSAADFADMNLPVRLVLGSEARSTARKVTEVLNDVLPQVELITVEGAEHMAPATQADHIDPLLVGHVAETIERQYCAAA